MTPHLSHEDASAAARLKAIFENVSDGILLVDNVGRALEVNQAWLDIHGYANLSEVPGHDNQRPWEISMFAESGELVPPQDWPHMEALRGREVRNRILRVVNLRTSREFYASYSCTPVYDNEHIRWMIVTIHDITDLKNALDRNESLLQEMIESRRQLENLTATLEDQVRIRTQQVRTLSRALTLAEQRERARFARVLHEDLQQVLLAAKMQLDVLDVSGDNRGALADDIDSANRLITKAVATSRSLALDLNPPTLDSEGLDASFKWLASHMQSRHGIPIETGVAAPLHLNQRGMNILLVQVVRELLASAIRCIRPERLLLVAYRARQDLVVLVEAIGGEQEGTQWMTGGGWGSLADHLQLFDGRINWERVRDDTQRVRVVLPIGEE